MALNVVGLFDTRQDAESAVQALRSSGFTHSDISFVGNNARGDYNDVNGSDEKTSEAAEGAGFGATGGAVLGGLAGLLVGLGALVIPGIGPVVAAGTLATTLGSTALGAGIGAAAGGLVGSLVGAGIPEEDAHVYAEGVRRGGALVSVQVDDETEANSAADIMNRYNVVDIDRRGEQFRSGGWNQFDHNAEPYDYASDTSSSGGMGDSDTNVGGDDYARSSKVGTAGGTLAGAATGAAIGSAGGPVGTVIGGIAGAVTGGGVGAAGDAAGVEATDDESDRSGAGYSTAGTTSGTAYGSTTDYSTTGTTGTTDYSTTGTTDYSTTGTNATNIDQGGEIKVPIVQEELRVGKRQVESGGVRVYTRVVEQPVNEQVTLRDEQVRVERRPVDRPVSDADMTNFQQGTFEVRETDEEAVVAKQARVVEEVHVKKQVEEHVETVQDTVRRTDVDVEQIPGQTRTTGYTETTGTMGTMGTSNLNVNTTNDEGVIERGSSGLGNAAEDMLNTDIDRDGDVGQRDPRNNF